MEPLTLTAETASDRKKWSWTDQNQKRADDILNVATELKEWWPLTARQIYYRLISGNLISQDHWKSKGRLIAGIYSAIGRTLKWMRIDDMLPWDAITDEHRVTTPKVGFNDTVEFVNYALRNILQGYAKCAAQKQINYIEIWVEKATLLHIVKPIADEFCRRVVICRGYNSVTFQAQFYNRATDAIGYGQQPIVLYFGDWDPSGCNMIYSAMQTLETELDLCGVHYYRAGINPEHFEAIEAAPVPLKPTDSRTKRFISQHGHTAYELDAFHPEELQKLVRDSIVAFTDMSCFDENRNQEAGELDKISDLRNDTIGFIHDRYYELGVGAA